MPYYRVDIAGASSWVHIRFDGRQRIPAPCAAPALPGDDLGLFGGRCARVSQWACDAPAGTRYDGTPQTCNMPLCDRHRTPAGPDRDLCPRHVVRGDPK